MIKKRVQVAGLVWDSSLFSASWECFDCSTKQSSDTYGYTLRGNAEIKLCMRCLKNAKEIEEAMSDVKIDLNELENGQRQNEIDGVLEGAKMAHKQLDIRLSEWRAKVKKES